MPMLFSESSQYQDPKYRSIIDLMDRSYTEAITINQVYWGQADTDLRFYCGDQDAWRAIYAGMPFNQSKSFNFNRIQRISNMISGKQRQDRKSITFTPIENSDEATADQFTKIFMWLDKQEGILESVSDAFEGALITGMNLIQVWMDYRNDPISGAIKVDNCAYNSFLIDPYFRKQDLSDCNYIWKRTYLTAAECISLLPDKKEDIEGLRGTGNKDGKFQFMPENYQADFNKLLTYDEFYYKTYRKQKMLVDTETGETLEWTSDDDEKLKQFKAMYPQVDTVECMVPTVNLAIVIQGRVMYDDRLELDCYPFVPVFAYYNPQIPSYHLRLQGIVRGLRDAQYLYNRRKVIELDMLESVQNTGWIYKEDALVNPKDVFQYGQGRGIALKSTAQMTDVQQIPPPQVPPTTIELSKIMGEEINQIAGISEEMLGLSVNDKSGILTALKQTAGLSALQGLFDRLDYSQRLLGRLILKLVQGNFTPGKVERIIEEKPSEQFYNKYFGKYDCVVAASINTDTQRQMALAQGLHLKEAGIPIPDSFFIENMVVQNKKEILDEIEQQKQQAQQQEQQQQQIQMAEIQARTNLANARAEADRGLGIERLSRVNENEAMAIERQAEASKDRMAGVLDMVKAMKEIEQIDINQIEKLVALANLLKTDELQTKAETQVESAKTKIETATKLKEPVV